MSFVQTTQKIYQFARNEPRIFKFDHHIVICIFYHILSKLLVILEFGHFSGYF